MALMTKHQFIVYAEEVLFGEGVECLYERIAEIRGEIARFGDAGPGSLYRLSKDIQSYNRIGERWAALTGRHFNRLAIPCPR